MTLTSLERGPSAFLDELLPSDSLFFQLQALEREIDSRILSKQLQIADSSFKTSKVKRNLKIFVSNTTEDVQLDSGETVPSWILRVEGKLETYGRHGRLANRKLSHYFQSMHVEFEPAAGGEKELVEWSNGPGVLESDGFELRRQGIPGSRRVTIILRLANSPETFRLAPGLATVLAMETGSRPEVILALWQYIKLHKLQESDDKKQILNDRALTDLFGTERMTFSELPEVIQPHLLPLEPIVIEYDLVLDGSGGDLVVQDVEVELEDPNKARPPVSPAIASLQREIGMADQRMAECIGALRTAQATTKILESFAQDPIACAQQLVARQTADLEMVVGEGDLSVNREDLNRAAAFDGDDIDGAIASLLSSTHL